MATRQRATAQDLWDMGEGDVRRELIDGEVVEMAPVGRIHGRITTRMTRLLSDFVERHGGGEVLVGDVGFILHLPYDQERVRAPDLAFVAADRLPPDEAQGFIEGAPDLAVEVLSPSDNPVDVQQKVKDYLDAGGRLVWVLAPAAKTATVYRADGSARFLRAHESLDGEDVLPGLIVPLSKVFDR